MLAFQNKAVCVSRLLDTSHRDVRTATEETAQLDFDHDTKYHRTALRVLPQVLLESVARFVLNVHRLGRAGV